MPTVNQEADRIVKGMKKNHHRFKELYGDRDKEVMYATANKLAQKKQVKQKTWKSGDGFKEENKSGDSSLRDWFSKSKSSDGKPGWVQLGGKYAGKPCAKQPGQTTKPKCGSSKMKRNLNKDEEEAAFRRKNAKDPNPNRKGKAINVKTEESYEIDPKKHRAQQRNAKIRALARKGATEGERSAAERKTKGPKMFGEGDFWHPDPDKDRKLGGPGANQRAREDRAAASKPKSDPKKLRPGESYMDYAKRMKTRKEDCWDGYEKKGMKTMFGKKYPNCVKKTKTKKEEVELTAEGKGEKDACYKKVKSRYSVWPSAYASGALVKCRKVGAANWGNKSKKEEFEGNLTFSQFNEKAQSCWKSHKKVGMKMKGGKLVNDCRPKNEETEQIDEILGSVLKGVGKAAGALPTANPMQGSRSMAGRAGVLGSAPTPTASSSQTDPAFNASGKSRFQKGGFGFASKSKGGKVKKEEVTNEGAAWTKKSGKNSEGGLNEKGRKSYERENPGSDLKAPSKKVGNPRRASFCARMKGMKAKLTSKKTASDPDSRINKSLRAWNC